MLKNTKKLALNFKVLKFFLIPTILLPISFLNNVQDAKAGLEFQWEQNSLYRKLRWYQKENKTKLRNTIYFFLRPSDRNAELLKINLAIPKTFKSTLNKNALSHKTNPNDNIISDINEKESIKSESFSNMKD